MGKYVIKRLLQLIPVVLGITFLSFAMMRLAGGDAVTYMYENAGTVVSQEVINEARAEYGLDQPFLVQYGKWLKGMLTGNLGESYVSHQDVAASFAAKLPATLLLAAVSLLFTILIALPLGILSAVKKNRWIDFVIRFSASSEIRCRDFCGVGADVFLFHPPSVASGDHDEESWEKHRSSGYDPGPFHGI
ncbi:MAG: ABC transporter permease [Lachnospiraceae bacterium]